MAEIVLTAENFDQEVLKSPVPVIVDFWAEWCGPCKVLSPIIEELEVDFKGKIKVGKVNVDDNAELSGKHQIMSIPTVKFFKGGKQVDEIIGAAPKSTLEAKINQILS